MLLLMMPSLTEMLPPNREGNLGTLVFGIGKLSPLEGSENVLRLAI